MKKALMLAAIAGLLMGSTAVAQDSIIGFDIRDGVTDGQIIPPTGVGADTEFPWTNGQDVGEPAVNAGGFGDGVIMRITPDHGDTFETDYPDSWPNFDGDGDSSTGQMWLYATVYDAAGCTDDVISSIGIDIDNQDDGAGGWNRIESMTFAWEAFTSDDTNEGTVDGASDASDPPDWDGCKLVKVPVETGPIYATGDGLVPGADHRIGKLTYTGGERTCPTPSGDPAFEDDSTFAVYLEVNNLLITRTCDGDSHNPEMVQFGYYPVDAPVNGSTMGAVSTDPDAYIVINLKGDNDKNGVVDNMDIPGFVAAKNASSGPPFLVTITQRPLFMNDFVTVAPPGDSQRVDNNDIPGFVDAKARGGLQPFPPPGNCP